VSLLDAPYLNVSCVRGELGHFLRIDLVTLAKAMTLPTDVLLGNTFMGPFPEHLGQSAQPTDSNYRSSYDLYPASLRHSPDVVDAATHDISARKGT
jgi:hypothetical protein